MLTVMRTGAKDYGLYMKALIVGPPGSGKTLTSSTWKNPIIASAEGGLMSIADRHTPYVKIEESEQLFQLKMLLEHDAALREEHLGFPVDTVIIDTIDEIQKILIRERLEATHNETLQLQDWGWLGDQMRAIIRGFRNLDMNVVMTCHVKDTTDNGTGRLFSNPALQGAVGDEIAGYVDLALMLKAQPETQIVGEKAVRVITRHLQTYPDAQHTWIKDRSGKLPPEVEINFATDYQRMFDAIFGDLPQDEPETREVTVPDSATKVSVAPTPTSAPTPTPVTPPASKPKAEAKAPKEKAKVVVEEKGSDPIPDTAQLKDAEAAASTDTIWCEECGGEVESQNQADLSKIRFRKVMCKECFTAFKKKK